MLDIDLVDLSLDDSIAVEDFRQFYGTVFTKEFSPDEIDGFQRCIDLKRESLQSNGMHEYHILLLYVNAAVAGVHIYDYFPTVKSMVCEFCCISPEFRRRGYASRLFSYPARERSVDWIFCEIEKDSVRNMACWKKNGVKKIGFDYIQLALGDGKQPCGGLNFCVKPMVECDSISAELVKETIRLYFRYAMFCYDTESDGIFRQITGQLSNVKTLKLMELI